MTEQQLYAHPQMPLQQLTLTAACSLERAEIKCYTPLTKDPNKVVWYLQKGLSKGLQKKGISLAWQTTPQECNLMIFFVRIKGITRTLSNLSWWFPIVSPLVVEIEGTLSFGGAPQQFHLKRRWYFWNLILRPDGMLYARTGAVGMDLIRFILKSRKQQQPYPVAPAQASQIEQGAAYPQTFQQPVYPEQVPAAVPWQIVEQAAVGQEEVPQPAANCPSCGISSPAGKAFCPGCGSAMKHT